MNQPIRILKQREVTANTGKSKTTIWQETKDGTFPPPIKLGYKATGYIEHEVQAVLHARAMGLSDKQLKELVASLVKQRKESASKLLKSLEQIAA